MLGEMAVNISAWGMPAGTLWTLFKQNAIEWGLNA
jgi:hypothetical protein